MSGWAPEDLSRIGRADELQVASSRPDGSLRPYVTIWVVRAGDDLYVRSALGPDNPWFRRAVSANAGRVRAEGREYDVRFETDADAPHAAIDAAYHAKYDRYGSADVNPVVGADKATLRLVPTA